MNKEFATYEQALALKNLDFDEPCFRVYTKDGSLKSKIWQEGDCSAPLKQQVFRWFREKYGLASQFAYYHVPKWGFEILEFTDIKITPNKLVCDFITPRTYEEAEDACIDKLIEIVKENGKH